MGQLNQAIIHYRLPFAPLPILDRLIVRMSPVIPEQSPRHGCHATISTTLLAQVQEGIACHPYVKKRNG